MPGQAGADPAEHRTLGDRGSRAGACLARRATRGRRRRQRGAAEPTGRRVDVRVNPGRISGGHGTSSVTREPNSTSREGPEIPPATTRQGLGGGSPEFVSRHMAAGAARFGARRCVVRRVARNSGRSIRSGGHATGPARGSRASHGSPRQASRLGRASHKGSRLGVVPDGSAGPAGQDGGHEFDLDHSPQRDRRQADRSVRRRGPALGGRSRPGPGRRGAARFQRRHRDRALPRRLAAHPRRRSERPPPSTTCSAARPGAREALAEGGVGRRRDRGLRADLRHLRSRHAVRLRTGRSCWP